MKTALLWIACLAVASSLSAQQCLLKNPSFETAAPDRAGEPDNWNVFTESGEVGASRLNFETAHHGTQSMTLAFDWERDHFFGIAQEVPVPEGRKVKFSGRIRNVSLKGSANIRLGMEWKSKDNREISRVQGEKIEPASLSDKEWKAFEVAGLVPAGTDHATITVTVFIGASTDGAVLVDTMWLEPVEDAKEAGLTPSRPSP